MDKSTFQYVLESPKMKQVLVMRRDLNLPAGKAIAQGAHASTWALKDADKPSLLIWESQGCTKIVLGVDTEDQLLDLADKLSRSGHPPRLVHDAGHTVLEAGTLTCLGVGPLPASVLDPVTGYLKLY